MDDPIEYRRSEVVAALSHALDLTEGQPIGHAGRTCLIGMAIGTRLSLTSQQLGSLYYALLLKDAGCSSSAARLTEIFRGADDLELKRAGKLVDFSKPAEAMKFVSDHAGARRGLARSREVVAAALEFARHGGQIVSARCERGAQIVSRLGFPGESAGAVRSLDERWDGKGHPDRLAGTQIPLLARIASVSQHVDFFLTASGRSEAREMVRKRRGTWFDPDVANAFLSIPDGDRLWPSLVVAHDPQAIVPFEPEDTGRSIVDEDLDRIALAFADVIDAKSPFTFNHSRGVARAAVAIAEVLDLPESEVYALRRTALLHDIGKLGVPNSILDKPGRLTDEERVIVNHHPRYTEEILSRVSAFAPIAFVAGAHHERVDAKGYHRGIGGADLPRDARILAVADVFDALHAERPYRASMPIEKIIAIMTGDAGTAFDPVAVEALLTCIDELTSEPSPAPTEPALPVLGPSASRDAA